MVIEAVNLDHCGKVQLRNCIDVEGDRLTIGPRRRAAGIGAIDLDGLPHENAVGALKNASERADTLNPLDQLRCIIGGHCCFSS